jgi:hypothetical protein
VGAGAAGGHGALRSRRPLVSAPGPAVSRADRRGEHTRQTGVEADANAHAGTACATCRPAALVLSCRGVPFRSTDLQVGYHPNPRGHNRFDPANTPLSPRSPHHCHVQPHPGLAPS